MRHPSSASATTCPGCGINLEPDELAHIEPCKQITDTGFRLICCYSATSPMIWQFREKQPYLKELSHESFPTCPNWIFFYGPAWMVALWDHIGESSIDLWAKKYFSYSDKIREALRNNLITEAAVEAGIILGGKEYLQNVF